jgi:hypothetical protein
MSLLYCYEKIAEGHVEDLRQEARLEALRAEARRASDVGHARRGAGRLSALRLAPLRHAAGFAHLSTWVHLSD